MRTELRRVGTLTLKLLVGALSLATALLAVSPAYCAEIKAERLPKTGAAFISILGEITAGDLAKFRAVAVAEQDAVVWLGSPGGSTVEAIEIGKAIRLMGLRTFVTDDAPCTSACALIWLAGETRHLSAGARVGFHATYSQKNGQTSESGVGNAIVGNYLAKLGLSERAIIFATSAGPDSFNWLTADNADDVGISISTIASDENTEENQSDIKGAQRSDEIDSEIYRTVGAWTVGIDSTLGNGCFLLSSYEGGIYFRVGIDARDGISGYLLVFGENWKSIVIGKKYKTSVKFGKNDPWEADALGVELSGLKGLMLSFQDKALLDEFGKARSARIFYQDEEVSSLALSDTKVALEAMWRCQRAQPTKSDPFAD